MLQFHQGEFELAIMADSTGDFSDFSPYVASLNDEGLVAFQAGLRRGGSGVYAGDGATIEEVIGGSAEAISHPDIDNDRRTCVYIESSSGVQSVCLVTADGPTAIAETPGALASIGPLGPTMNDEGVVAFRADLPDGAHGIFVGWPGGGSSIAESGSEFASFEGLPVVIGDAVVFRANRHDGRQGIYMSRKGIIHPVVETGDAFTELGRFPSMSDSGVVVFVASRPDGTSGVFAMEEGLYVPILESGDSFESFRGAIVAGDRMAFFATPHGGELGVYGGPTLADRIVGISDSFLGSTVSDLALNPVSINRRGQLAIRLKLADDRQFIVRADPV